MENPGSKDNTCFNYRTFEERHFDYDYAVGKSISKIILNEMINNFKSPKQARARSPIRTVSNFRGNLSPIKRTHFMDDPQPIDNFGGAGGDIMTTSESLTM